MGFRAWPPPSRLRVSGNSDFEFKLWVFCLVRGQSDKFAKPAESETGEHACC